MKIGLLQYNPYWENKDKNKRKIIELLSNNLHELSLLILPEMTLTGFTMNAQKLSESITGDTYNFYAGIAKQKKIHVLGGLIEKEKDKYFNTLIHVNPEGMLVTKYQKIHPYSLEDKYYARGEDTTVTQIEDMKVGLSICYDLRFPELYRTYAKERVDLIVNVANWPITRIEHWKTLLKARAIENQCYMAGVNRIGNDPKLVYDGYSSVYDPMGNKLVTSINEEKVITTEITHHTVVDIREKLPFLDDIFLI